MTARAPVAAIVALGAAPLLAQEPLEFGASVEAVSLDVFVSRDGEPVSGLSASNFEVREDGARRDVEVVLREEAPPLDVVLVLDTSASVAGERLELLKRAAASFLTGLGRGDRATLTTFSHRTGVHGPLGGDPAALLEPLAAARAVGGTALYDAVYAGLQLADPSRGRPAVVVFSDGEDGLSWLSAEQVEQTARELEAVVFAIHARRDPIPVNSMPRGWTMRQDPSTRFLRAVTDETGGQLWEASDDLDAAFRDVLAALASRYLLRVRPGPGPCGRWRELEVRLRGRKGQLRARRGYAIPCAADQGS